MSSSDLHRHRMDLIPLRAELREVQRYLTTRESELAAGVDGKNAEERKARASLSVASDDLCIKLRDDAEGLGREIEQHEAAIEHLRDLRRDYEWNIRLRLAAALDGRGLPPEQRPDEAFDIASDELSIDIAAAQVPGRVLGTLDEAFEPEYQSAPYMPRTEPPRRNHPVHVLVNDEDFPF